jgi:D-arabinose 1-dehydrogenase
MPPTQPPLSTVLPSLICGTATFNNQYNLDAFKLPCNAIVQRALELGVTAFDTSPYYGPSESLLGAALAQPTVAANFPRESYHILTKVGRVGASEFDYSPEWVRYSVQRSCERLNTDYLDVVYCHDVEFVTPVEVLEAVTELRRIRDITGTIKYIGISGYPVPLLCELSELILASTGEPIDVVMSYANFTLQNTTLHTEGLERLRKAGVGCVPNASPLGMGLLRTVGVPVGGKGDFHPAPPELRAKVAEAARYVAQHGDKIETVAIRWALETWVRTGAILPDTNGISVMGVSNLLELEETMSVYNSILDGLPIPGREVSAEKKTWSEERRKHIGDLAEAIWAILAALKDYTWASPEEGYVNMRVVKGVVDVVAPLPSTITPTVEENSGTEKVVKTSRL